MPAESDIAQHLLVFGGMTVALLGGALGILKGWGTVIDQMKAIVREHETRERAWAEEGEAHAANFRAEVLERLERVEVEVQQVREHLISDGRIPLATTPPGWPLKP
jgi:hypothetical protein